MDAIWIPIQPAWIVPFREMGFNLIKREVRDAIKLRYDLLVMIFPPLDYRAIFLQLSTQ